MSTNNKIKNYLQRYILPSIIGRGMGVGLLLALFSLASCSSDEDSFFTVSPDDAPRILNTDFPSGGFSINRNENLRFEILVTPADYTTVTWLVDDKEVFEGNTIDKAFEAGEYKLKIVATTVQGKQTSRLLDLKVKALADDPVANEKPAERLQAPGSLAKVSGSNLSNIRKVSVAGQQTDVTSNAAEYVEYTVPSGLADGQYRLSLIDAEGLSFGGGIVTITSSATVSKADFSAVSGGKLELPGCKLDEVQAVTINGQNCDIQSKEEAKVIVKVPELEEGTYELRAVNGSGAAVKFLGENGLEEVAAVKITFIAENVLWEGKHAVDWGTIWEDDGTVTAKLKESAGVGSVLRLYVKRTDTEYAMACATVGWTGIVTGGTEDKRGDINISFEDTYVDFVLTATSFELLNGGNLQVVGHGFDLLKMTLVPPTETTLWEGKHAVDWGTIWEDDGTVTAKLKESAGVGSVLRLYVKRTDTEYAMACATVGWTGIVTGGTEDKRGDINISFEDTQIDFILNEKSFELLNGGNLQVVGHGFDLTKITIE